MGEIWTIGTKPQIKWWTRNFYNRNVNIELSTNSGSSWSVIRQNESNDGVLDDWVVPNTPSTKCKIRFSDTEGADVFAVSDGFFTITKPSFRFISPVGGEVWKPGTNQIIKWQSLISCKNVNIDLSTDNGSTWTEIRNNTPNDGKIRDWIVPNLPSSQCKLRITDAVSNLSAVSNTFTILAPSIQITSPAGGEVWKVGSNPILRWQSTALSKSVKIDLSTDGGLTWDNIRIHTPDDGKIRDWIVPNTPSTQCKIRITDTSGSPAVISNGVFTIKRVLGKSNYELTSTEIPKEFSLSQNFPNPFNPETIINYQIPDLGGNVNVQLKVYDILGREIITLINEEQSPGYYQAAFNGSSLTSGVYIYKLTAGNFNSIKKMILTK